MKRLIVLLMLLMPVSVIAGPCGDYDFSEINAMKQDVFVQEYRTVLKFGKVYANLAMYSNRRSVQGDFDSCYNLLMKFERVYLQKFGDKDNLAAMKEEMFKQLENEKKGGN